MRVIGGGCTFADGYRLGSLGRHALPGSGDALERRPIRLGLLQPGPCVLCAVADPSNAAPVLQMPGSLAETGRGLQIICQLSDQWGYAASGRTGKVVWAILTTRLIVTDGHDHVHPGVDGAEAGQRPVRDTQHLRPLTS